MTTRQFKRLPLQARFRLFVQWLGNQPEHGKYSFVSVTDCAMCQFARTLETTKRHRHLSAGADGFCFFVNGRPMEIQLIPDLSSWGGKYGLHMDHFGLAYNSLAKAAGLPRRSWRHKAFCHLASRFVKHKHALAA